MTRSAITQNLRDLVVECNAETTWIYISWLLKTIDDVTHGHTRVHHISDFILER